MILLRLLKGAWMGLHFFLFAWGIGVGVLVIIPVCWLLGLVRGPDPRRMQGYLRVMLRIWLRGLALGGLLRTRPARGAPVDGPCVIVANHPGLFDVVVLIREIPHLSVMAHRKLARRLPLGGIFRQAGYVLSPDPAELLSATETFQAAALQLRQGNRFLLFPEGTRSPRGELGRFRAGAFRIAALARVPIQPVLIRNHPPFLCHGDRWYLPAAEPSWLELEYLPPLPPPEDPQIERQAAAALEQQFRELLGLGRA